MRSKKGLVVVGALAAVLALTITSLATGGVSLKSLVKKEVAKQLRGKTGPQGPAGAAGGAGASGSPGQTGPTAKVQVGPTTDLNTTNNIPLLVNFDAEDYDPSGMHSTSVNPSRLTVPVAGVYAVDVNAVWPNNGTGARVATVFKNNAHLFEASQNGTSSAGTSQSFSDQVRLAAGDYLELKVVQGSGGDLALLGGGVAGTTMAVTWIAP